MQPVSEFSRLRIRVGLSIDEVANAAGFSRSTVYRWERGIVPPRRAALKLLGTMAKDHRSPVSGVAGKPTFRFIDLFAGIGGLRRGFEPRADVLSLRFLSPSPVSHCS